MKVSARSVLPLVAASAGGGLAFVGLCCLWFLARGAHPAVTFGAIGLAGSALAVGGCFVFVRSERSNRERARLAAAREIAATNERMLALESAKAQSDLVLGSVRAHLMLIDPTFFIVSRYSNELDDVFHQKEFGSENLLSVLQRLLSERMFRTARDYLGLLFDPEKRERVVLKVNPLEEIEAGVRDERGQPVMKYLSFGFRRIMESERIVRVLVSVEDITDRTVLQRQLRDSELQKVKQFELLIEILHVDPDALDDFVRTATEQLARVDEALKASDFNSAAVGQSGLLLQRLDIVLQRVHNIKGNATLLHLDHFERKAQDFEQKVIELKYRGALGGDDFLTLVIELADFRSDLDSLQTLRVKLAGIQRNIAIREEVGDDLVASLRDLVASLAAKLGKNVRLDAHGFDTRALPAPTRLIVKDVLIQLVRNSLAHGIESPEERALGRKPRVATIDLHPTPDPEAGTFSFVYRDDGRGLDAKRIAARAIELGLAEAETSSVDETHVASFIFAPGFSTQTDATLEAGRGMGMNVVKQRVVDDCGGEITVNSEAGNFCEFTFVVPAPAIAAGTMR